MKTRSKIAVAGATGRVGRHVVDVLEAGGHDVVAMSRSGGVDVVTGDGLAEALAGVECVIDVASGPSPDQEAATEFFIAAARNLHEAGERAGVQPRRSPTWPSAPNRRPHRDPPRHRSRRSPVRGRKALSIWRDCSPPGTVIRCGSRA